LLVATLPALGEHLPRLRGLGVHLPEPLAHRLAALGVPRHDRRPRLAHVLGDDGRLRHLDRRRHAARLPDRQLAHRVRGDLSADDRLQRAAEGGVRADPRRLVRHRRRPGGADRVPDLVLPITVNIATGLATLEPELEDVLRVLGAKRWDVLVKVGLPRSMPYFYGSLKVAITLAFVGTTVSEMTGGERGHRLPADLGRLVDADGPGRSPGWW
jgi:hypothetical protein